MIKITYSYPCCICDKEGVVSLQDDIVRIPIVKLPDGWSEVHGHGYICPDHMITINDMIENELNLT